MPENSKSIEFTVASRAGLPHCANQVWKSAGAAGPDDKESLTGKRQDRRGGAANNMDRAECGFAVLCSLGLKQGQEPSMPNVNCLAKTGTRPDWDISFQGNLWLALLFVVVGVFLSAVIPPLQSPDEFAHVKRAYLLSKGVIVLEAPDGHASGGMIDSGLTSYFSAFTSLPSKPDKKLSIEELESARTVRWTGIKEFSIAPGTGFYFPLIYMPQALGLALGEKLGMTVDTSYQLARFISLASIAVILFVAFSMYPVNPLVIALLIMPMSAFQVASASLDGISTALAVLSIAIFLKISSEKENASPWLFYALALSVILVTTSRAHLISLLLLLLVSCFYKREKKYFAVFFAALLFILFWFAIAINTTGATRTGAPTSSIALHYITHPQEFFRVLFRTLSENTIVSFYRNSFFGVLGWLDASFSENAYVALSVCIALIGIFSVSISNVRNDWNPRLVVFLAAVASIFLIFFLLLITWTPHPAVLIEGVQGRYFLVPLIMVAYAISGGARLYEGMLRKIAVLFTLLLGAFTIFGTPRLLIERYYLALEKIDPVPVMMRPSPPLDQSRPISLLLNQGQISDPKPIKKIGIQLGTYNRTNSGSAELRLMTTSGDTVAIPFDLSALLDNQYKYFELDPKPYVSGQIDYLTGGGISSWEAHDEKGAALTCLVFEYADGMKRYTRGCSRK